MKNSRNLLKISFYSRRVLNKLLQDESIDFGYKATGILHIFKNANEIKASAKHFDWCMQYESEQAFKVLNHQECINLDPSLEILMKKRKGGIYLPNDAGGDAHLFAQQLQKICQKSGVKFYFNTDIKKIVSENGKMIGVDTTRGLLKAQKYVVALGAYTAQHMTKLGIKLPIYPMKGYSISIPTDRHNLIPKLSITDHHKKIVFTNLAGTFRIGGTVEFAGYDHSILMSRITPIMKATKKFFPNAGDFSNASYWSCLRAQTPRSTPIVGETGVKNLYINSGQGSLGWTQSAGSGKLLADIIVKNQPEIDLTGLRCIDYGEM